MTITAVLPLKQFVHAKQRLSGILTASERQHFFHAMVQDVLLELTQCKAIANIVILSNDAAAPLLANFYGVDYLRESVSLSSKGLNQSLMAVLPQLIKNYGEQLIVVHGDLPELSHHAISEFIEKHLAVKADLSIATDYQQQGSNVLLCNKSSDLIFNYGRNSAACYAAQAQRKQWRFYCGNIDGLNNDIDELANLYAFIYKENMHNKKSYQYLAQHNITRRIELIANTLTAEALITHY